MTDKPRGFHRIRSKDWFPWPSTDIHGVVPWDETVYVKSNGDCVPATDMQTALWIMD